jgi:hypothetical protein
VALAKTAKLQSVTIKDSIANLTNNRSSLKSVLGTVTTINLTDTTVDAKKLKTLKDGVAATNAAIFFKNAGGTTI